MKKKIELDVDFIGGQTPTKADFFAISKYIKDIKAKQKLKEQRRVTSFKRNAKQPT